MINNMVVVDIHPHIISKDEKKYPITPLGGKRSVWSAERPIDFENLVQSMDQAGVDKAAIVHSSTTYGFDNTYMVDAIKGNPRFTGVGSVDFLAPDASEKIRAWHKQGVTGLRIFSAGSTMDKQADTLDDPKSYKAWETAEELKIPIVTQMRKEGLHMLYNLVRKFPRNTIIVDHLIHAPRDDKGPNYDRYAFLFELAKYPNVYFKCSTNNVRHSHDEGCSPETFFPKLVKEIPSNRIAWGSNYPASKGSLKEMVDEAKAAFSCLSQEDQANIWGKTALKLYPALNK